MDRHHLLNVFVAVAEEQGFAAAARRLGMSPPAVTRAIGALEERLKVRLLTRTTRTVRVTEPGHRYLADAQRVLADFDAIDAAASGAHAVPRGQLNVTAPALFGRSYVTPLIAEFLARYPDCTANALFLDRVVNMVDEGMDAGIRIGPLPDSSLRAIRVATVRRVVVASPAYLAAHGAPRKPADLKRHRIVAATSIASRPEWVFAGNGAGSSKTSAREAVRVQPRFFVNTNDAALEAAVRGFGLTRLLSYQVAPQVAAGQLRIVLGKWTDEELPVHVVHHEGRHASAKVRAFVDLAVDGLRGNKALQ